MNEDRRYMFRCSCGHLTVRRVTKEVADRLMGEHEEHAMRSLLVFASERRGVEELNAYYFGTYRGVGHYLWMPGRFDPVTVPHFPAGSKPPPAVVVSRQIPWGTTPDGILNPKPEVEGEALLHHKDGWTAIAFANRTDDKRGGSNAVFMFDDTLSFDEAVEAMKHHFPQIVDKFSFEVREVTK